MRGFSSLGLVILVGMGFGGGYLLRAWQGHQSEYELSLPDFPFLDKDNLTCRRIAYAGLIPRLTFSEDKRYPTALKGYLEGAHPDDDLLVEFTRERKEAKLISMRAIRAGYRDGDTFLKIEDKDNRVMFLWIHNSQVSIFALDKAAGRAVLTKNYSAGLGMSGQSTFFECS